MNEIKALKTELINVLEEISKSLSTTFSNQNAYFSDLWGTEGLPITVDDIRFKTELLIENIEAIDLENSPKLYEKESDQYRHVYALLRDMTKQAKRIHALHCPQILNSASCSRNIVDCLYFMDSFVSSIRNEIGVPDFISISAKVKKRFEAIDEIGNQINDQWKDVQGKLKTISDAFHQAEDLPITTRDLQAAKELVKETEERIRECDETIQHSLSDVLHTELELRGKLDEANATTKLIQEKYAAFTSVGLAKAFAERAKERKLSVQKWTLLLIAALTICALIGAERFPLLLQSLNNNAEPTKILINMFYGFLSMGPAIWLAWISSAQIGMNYRISEDYNYKSTLASSYEGFRSEAIRIDPYLEAKLFMIAMERLDEIPLRFVDPTVKKSPLHELLSSDEFKQVIQSNDELKLRVISIIKDIRTAPSCIIESLEKLKTK